MRRGRALRVPVTLKMRCGLDDSEESRDCFWRILDGALALGVAAVTVHGRTVRQRYEGHSSWDFLREVKEHIRGGVVFGSGDLFTADDCREMIFRTRVDGVTIVRGAIGNPWIFRDLRGARGGTAACGSTRPFRAAGSDPRALSARRGDLWSGSSVPRDVQIRHQVLAAAPAAREVRDAFVAVHRPEQWREVLERWYAEDLPGVRPIAATPGDAVGR